MEPENTAIQIYAGFANPAPYPELRVYGKNRYYAELLMDDYCGAWGEFTAANQYKYHALVLKKVNPELAELFSGIAAVEMRHLELLAEAIQSLGGNPVFRGGRGDMNYWSTEKLEYGRDIAGRLKSDLDAETNSIKTYRDHIRKIQDPGVQTLLRRIVLDEEVHARLFKEAIDKYCTAKKAEKKEEIKEIKTPQRVVRHAMYSSRR
jgi:bacterioferritin